MQTVRTMIGMPVIIDGHRAGRMVQAELSDDLKRLEGIWVGAGFGGSRYISSEDLEMIGRVSIISGNRGKRRRIRACPILRRAVSTDGRLLGAITDAEIDDLSFSVTALELSAGVWDDLLRPRQRVTRYAVNRETGEVIVKPPEGEMEDETDEERNDPGLDRRIADRQRRGDDLRRCKLADRAEVEPGGPKDGQLDL